MQMGQLANSLSEREEEESPSQSIVNLEGQFETEASSHFEQAKTTTLRYDKVVDDHVGEPEVVNVQKDEDVTQSSIENISMSPEPPTSALVRYESIPTYIPREPFSLRLTGSIRKEDSLHEPKKILLTKNVRSFSMVNMDKFLFPKDFIILDTQLMANMINQIPIVLGRPFLTTSNAVIYCRSEQLELSFENFKVH